MVMAESPADGNSGGQPQIERLRISHLLVVALLAAIKYPGKEHDPVLLCSRDGLSQTFSKWQR